MVNAINITSRQDLTDTIKYFSPEEIDYFYFDCTSGKGGASLYYLSIGFKVAFSSKKLAYRLGEFIISKYEHSLLNQILKHYFIDFSESEIEEIIETAQNSMIIFNQIYNNAIIVNNLTNILDISNEICIEGFLNFRANEYRRIAYTVISDAVEKLLVKEEYDNFIDMVKEYIKQSISQIDLLHIKPNSDGSFTFFNFKMERIIFEINEINPVEIFVTTQDMLMSILISLIPKRIIWHNTPDCKQDNITSTLKQIFGNKFCICDGCEICKN